MMRHGVDESSDVNGLSNCNDDITVRPNGRAQKVIMTVIIMVVWLISGVYFMTALRSDMALTGAYIVAWLGFGVVMLASLAWTIFGAEVVSIRSTHLKLERKLGKSTVFAKTFEIADIRHM